METPLTPLDFLRRAGKLYGGRLAVVDGDIRLTYAQFRERCDRWTAGLAELKDLSLGDLLEGIVLHAFEGRPPFSPETLAQISELNKIYGMTLRAGDSHRLREK